MKKLLLLLLLVPMVSFGQGNIFVLDKDFLKVSSDIVDKTSYIDDFKKVTKWSRDYILNLVNNVVQNNNVLFYVDKKDFRNLITIEKSELQYSFITNNEKLFSNSLKNEIQKSGNLLYFDSGQNYFKSYNYFYVETNLEIKENLIQDLPNWSNQYWININNITYHLSVNSSNGLRIENVLIEINSNMSVEEYINRGIERRDSNNYNGAISDFTAAIRIKPDFDFAYYQRAYAKEKLKDYYGAIKDLSKAIELKPDYAMAYSNRGVAKRNLEDYYGAISDYSKAIELNPDYTYAYVNRGISKEDLGDLNGACADWRKAASLGDKDAAQWVRDQCN